jgi:hypothetical protein
MEGAAVAGAPSMHSSVFNDVKTWASLGRVESFIENAREMPEG